MKFTGLAQELKQLMRAMLTKGLQKHNLNGGRKFMLETIIVILLVLWLIGLVTSNTFGGILHLLLLVALVVFIIRLLTGRKVV
jgi:hypothetical protein